MVGQRERQGRRGLQKIRFQVVALAFDAFVFASVSRMPEISTSGSMRASGLVRSLLDGLIVFVFAALAAFAFDRIQPRVCMTGRTM